MRELIVSDASVLPDARDWTFAALMLVAAAVGYVLFMADRSIRAPLVQIPGPTHRARDTEP